MTTNITNSQAASIDTPEFRRLLTWHASHPTGDSRLDIIAHIDAKLAQAGDDWRDRANVLEARLGEVMEKRDEWRRMAEGAMDDVADHYKRLCKAEAKLAEWEKIVEVSLANDYATRAIAAESRLAEIQRASDKLIKWETANGNDVYDADEVEELLALLQPQGQADTK